MSYFYIVQFFVVVFSTWYVINTWYVSFQCVESPDIPPQVFAISMFHMISPSNMNSIVKWLQATTDLVSSYSFPLAIMITFFRFWLLSLTAASEPWQGAYFNHIMNTIAFLHQLLVYVKK